MINFYINNVQLMDYSVQVATAIQTLPGDIRQLQFIATDSGPSNATDPVSTVRDMEYELGEYAEAVADMINDNLIAEISMDILRGIQYEFQVETFVRALVLHKHNAESVYLFFSNRPIAASSHKYEFVVYDQPIHPICKICIQLSFWRIL